MQTTILNQQLADKRTAGLRYTIAISHHKHEHGLLSEVLSALAILNIVAADSNTTLSRTAKEHMHAVMDIVNEMSAYRGQAGGASQAASFAPNVVRKAHFKGFVTNNGLASVIQHCQLRTILCGMKATYSRNKILLCPITRAGPLKS